MGIPYSEIDNMTLYEFRLYQEGYRKRMRDFESLARPVAYCSMIGPGNIKNPPTIDEFWPLDDKPRALRKVKKIGTEKWSAKKLKAAEDFFTRKAREQLYGRSSDNKREQH